MMILPSTRHLATSDGDAVAEAALAKQLLQCSSEKKEPLPQRDRHKQNVLRMKYIHASWQNRDHTDIPKTAANLHLAQIFLPPGTPFTAVFVSTEHLIPLLVFFPVGIASAGASH